MSIVTFYNGKIGVSIDMDSETFGAFFTFGGVEVIEVGERFYIVLLLLFLLAAGCTSPEKIAAPFSESAGGGEGDNLTEIANTEIAELTGSETEEELEEAVEEWPERLAGEGEAELLSVRILAEIEADRQQYNTTMVFSNKSDSALSILYDCGLLLSNDRFAPKAGICPSVESMLLKGGGEETLTVTLPAAFFNTEDRMITVRYRQDNVMHELLIGMR